MARHRNFGKQLVLPGQVITGVKYFTSRISGGHPADSLQLRRHRDEKRRRQTTYLDALQSHSTRLQIIEGQFLAKTVQCNQCGGIWRSAEEKMTDVNIATEMLVDAFEDQFDTAIVVSGDSDLVPPIRAIRNCFPHKRVLVAFPPGRSSVDLRNAANGQFLITKGLLRKAQLPARVASRHGDYILERPANWA